jgi:hypothetical protein
MVTARQYPVTPKMKKEIDMRRKLTWVVLLAAAIVVTALYPLGKVLATPSSGFMSTTLSLGQFGDIDVFNRFPPNSNEDDDKNVWRSRQKTEGLSDLYVQSNVWQPGGTTGWHTHLGHSLITVTAGTLTEYDGHDPNCTPHVYTAGMGFVDPAAGHVHIVRNEGTVVAQAIAVQLIPSGQPRRIDAPDPGNCNFPN